MNFLWIDVETSGLYSEKHDIVQLACIPVINGVEQESFNEFCQPKNWDAIQDEAIRVHGITREMMKGFQTAEQMIDKFIKYLEKFDTKFIISGFNVNFDRQFVSATFNKVGRPKEFFRLFDLQIHDTYTRAKEVKSKIGTENLKLETLANHWGFKIQAHDALSDISATIHVDKQVGELLGEESDVAVEHTEVEKDVDVLEPAQLHLHSMYDMSESIPTIKEWEKWCVDNNISAFSIVDHGSAISLYEMKGKQDSAPTRIPGVGLYLLEEDELFMLNAWATSTQGYYNLMKLASRGYDNGLELDGINRPILRREWLSEDTSGIVFGTGGDMYDAIAKRIAEGDIDAAQDAFDELVSIFGKEKLVVELAATDVTFSYSPKRGFQRIKKNELVPDGNLAKAYNKFLYRVAQEGGIKIIPSAGANFIAREDKLLQDVIMRNSHASGKCYSESYHAKNGKEMYKILKSHLGDQLKPEIFNGWSKNTLDIAEQAKSIEIKHEYHMPKIDIPEHIKKKTDDYDKQTLYYTIELCKQHGRWKDDPEYIARFKKEIDVIMKNKVLNFLPYFLLYEDISTYGRSRGILQNIGRGSAGGCLLSYYLKIIHIDPIEADLPFERFFSHARINAGSFPDIDSDFGDRTEILAYLEEKYGNGFAQICTFSTFKVKNAIKDAMWALYGKNRNDPIVKSVCDFIPDSPQGVKEKDFLYGFTNKEGEHTPGAIDEIPELKKFFEQYQQVEEMVKRLIGLVRGWSRHASAFVVSTLDLASTRVPIVKMHDKRVGKLIAVTQFEASMCEGSGLVKADILGVTTIQSVYDCIELVKERHGIDYLEEDDNGTALIYRLPEDKRVYKDFYHKRTDSSFQFNSSLIKGYIQQFAPVSRAQLSDMTALCRPGALDAPFVNDEISIDDGISAAQYYMDVRNGTRKLSYLHPDLATCTSNGVFVYQEEVMKFLVDYAGYSLEESDRIRGAIAKKKHDVMMESFERIRKNTAARGWTPEQADVVCDMIQAFARYSFNRSHSRCYAELGYITMYLKHHHKLEWWASELNNSMHKEEKVRHYITLLGDLVTSPSLAKPSKYFKIVGDKIVAPLSVLKRVGDACINELVSKGPFKDIDDYIDRVNHSKCNKGHFEALIKGRAADDFMRKDIPYPKAREELMEYYKKRRKCNKFNEDLLDPDPLKIFLLERDTNKTFNKSVSTNPEVLGSILSHLPDIKPTHNKRIPLADYSSVTRDNPKPVPIIPDIKVAEALLEKGVDDRVGMLLLFEGSSTRSGKSKKNGKPYKMLKIQMSDGYNEIEGIRWDADRALNFPKDSIIYIKGKLKDGWKTKISFQVDSITRIG